MNHKDRPPIEFVSSINNKILWNLRYMNNFIIITLYRYKVGLESYSIKILFLNALFQYDQGD